MGVWAKRNEVGSDIFEELCQMITDGKTPGFDIIQDVCGADAPIVLYNEHPFTSINKPEYGESVKRRSNLNDYVAWVVAGDYSKPFEPSIKPKIESFIDVPKDDLLSLTDIATEIQGQEPSAKEVFGEVISTYTRAEAQDDGVLIDVTEIAKEAGIVYPVAISQGLWEGYIEVPESLKVFRISRADYGMSSQCSASAPRRQRRRKMMSWDLKEMHLRRCSSRLYFRCPQREVPRRWKL